MEAEGYSFAWSVYIACVAAVLVSQLAFLWVLGRRWVFFAMGLTAIICLLPFELTQPELSWKAPAVAVVFIDYFLQKGSLWQQALDELLHAVALFSALFVLFLLALMLWEKYRTDTADAENSLEFSDTEQVVEEGISANKE